MKNLRKFKVLFAGLALFASIALLAVPASADLVFGLDTEFSGATPPAGSTPWVTATFADIAGGVQLTIAALNLVGSEFVSEFYFNFNPALNAASFLPSPTDTGTQTAWNSIGSGNDAFKADGDGFFDFVIDFPPPPGAFPDKFTAGETFSLNILGAGLTTADFNFASVNGPVGKTGFYAAAHIQGIGADGEDSGWIGTGPTPVPEPSSLLLLGTGIGMVAFAFRKSRGNLLKK